MQIGAMNHPARDVVAEIDWIGDQGFDFVDLTLEPPAGEPGRIDVDAIRAALDRHHDRWDEYIDRLGPKLAHVHLSDNDSSGDQHLPLGSAPRSTTD